MAYSLIYKASQQLDSSCLCIATKIPIRFIFIILPNLKIELFLAAQIVCIKLLCILDLCFQCETELLLITSLCIEHYTLPLYRKTFKNTVLFFHMPCLRSCTLSSTSLTSISSSWRLLRSIVLKVLIQSIEKRV